LAEDQTNPAHASKPKASAADAAIALPFAKSRREVAVAFMQVALDTSSLPHGI
jgi:hypothetical protein